LLVALDSRRAELYLQLFAADRTTPVAAPAARLPDDVAAYVAELIGGMPLLVAGDAAGSAAAGLRQADVTVLEETAPDAQGVAAAAFGELRAGVPARPAHPFYLRPPDVTLPKPRQPVPVGSR